eukprot:TRINITY_DN5560_c0_g1_i1.p1 TRINITY_DN5560_c0_g1~~TRINITY_DN5560_c0_g1_i1.p1  ORF type:complete len:374 (-),score=64.84 TRINITY_DN5560_c0_g1_i1:391-1512(-)
MICCVMSLRPLSSSMARTLATAAAVSGPTGTRRPLIKLQGKIWKTRPRLPGASSTAANTIGSNDASKDHHVEEVWQADPRDTDSAVIELHSKDHRPVGFHGLGVLKEDKVQDLHALVDGFTSPALAAALRDRESTLQMCAHLLDRGELDQLKRVLQPYTAQQVQRLREVTPKMDLSAGLKQDHMAMLRKYINRMPRHLAKSTEHRASVMIPLCNVESVPSVLFTKRSDQMRTHRNEVCFPGGKVDHDVDKNIFHTAVREMVEEVGLQSNNIEVLGVLRCDWSEVASHVGVAVTPVVGFMGDLTKEQLRPNPDEVSHCFTIPVDRLLDQSYWSLEKFKAPVFTGGPYVIWGLTGYILHRFVQDVLEKVVTVDGS